MTRNINRRVEALVPVAEPVLQAELDHVLDVNLADDQLACSLDGDGRWRRAPGLGDGGVNTHLALQHLAEEVFRRTARER